MSDLDSQSIDSTEVEPSTTDDASDTSSPLESQGASAAVHAGGDLSNKALLKNLAKENIVEKYFVKTVDNADIPYLQIQNPERNPGDYVLQSGKTGDYRNVQSDIYSSSANGTEYFGHFIPTGASSRIEPVQDMNRGDLFPSDHNRRCAGVDRIFSVDDFSPGFGSYNVPHSEVNLSWRGKSLPASFGTCQIAGMEICSESFPFSNENSEAANIKKSSDSTDSRGRYARFDTVQSGQVATNHADAESSSSGNRSPTDDLQAEIKEMDISRESSETESSENRNHPRYKSSDTTWIRLPGAPSQLPRTVKVQENKLRDDNNNNQSQSNSANIPGQSSKSETGSKPTYPLKRPRSKSNPTHCMERDPSKESTSPAKMKRFSLDALAISLAGTSGRKAALDKARAGVFYANTGESSTGAKKKISGSHQGTPGQPGRQVGRDIIECRHCRISFSKLVDVIQHISESHPNTVEMHVCEDCEIVFFTKSRLRQHKRENKM